MFCAPLARVDGRPGLPLPWLERSVPADVQIRGVAPSGRGWLGRWRLLLDGAVGLEVEVGGQAPLDWEGRGSSVQRRGGGGGEDGEDGGRRGASGEVLEVQAARYGLAVGRPPLRLARGKRAVGPEMQVGGAVQANVGELQLARTQASSS